MNRTFYSEYVRHCMRYYSRNTNKPQFKTEVDKNNWYACHKALERYSDKFQDIILHVYVMNDTLADNVYEVAKLHNVDQKVVWDTLKEFERLVARKRGLI